MELIAMATRRHKYLIFLPKGYLERHVNWPTDQSKTPLLGGEFYFPDDYD